MALQQLKSRSLTHRFHSFHLTPYFSGLSSLYRRISHRLFLTFFTCLLLLSGVIGQGGLLPTPAFAASLGKPASAPASMTFAQFLKQGRDDKAYHGPLLRTGKIPTGPKPTHTTDYTHLPSTAEAATMKPIAQPLTPAFLRGSAGSQVLDLVGSDGRLEVQIQPGSFDLSQATVANSGHAHGTLTLRLTQLYGHYISDMNELGSYQLQVTDAHGRVVNGIALLHPVTFRYHYQPSDLTALGIDPGQVILSWPALIVASLQAKKSTVGLTTSMQNNAATRTLTARSQVRTLGPFDLSAEPANQSPPALHLASMQGNNGQLTYSYPLQVPPGAGGFVPQLSLNYSSAGPNERHSPTSPAGDEGDGWSLDLGSVSEETYAPSNTQWYFLNNVAGVGDRLIPTGSNNLFDTEHISYLRVQQINPGTNSTCFHVWDKSGTYYELGCTADSLEFWTDSNGVQHDYAWNVNKIIAPNEGANAGTYRLVLASYVQDKTTFTSNGHVYTNIRDASLKQIIYGSGSTNSVTNVSGTVDFLYHGPNNISSTSGDSSKNVTWVRAYGTNYNCTSTPPVSTTFRCDDPVADGSAPAPAVMSTLTLDTVATYVGSDANYEAQSYAFSYSYSTFKDNPFSVCYDAYTLVQEYCAGDHLLMSVTPTIYQNNSGHLLKGLTFGYSSPLQNTYYDSANKTQNGSQQYGGQTFWQYMNFYEDLDTGVGGRITWARAYNNAHGTPTVKSGNTVTDDRYDALYCTTHANDPNQALRCTGSYAHPDDHAWSEQVVTSITTLGTDSSSSSLQQATTTYGYYRLAKTGTWDGKSTWCEPDQYNQEQDCVGDNWVPSGDTDWRDYYHAEYQGFAQVWSTSPSNDLTVDYYYSTEGWNTPKSDYQNFQGGFLFQKEYYSGNSYTSSALLQKTVNTYANSNSACRSTTPIYPACEVMVLSTKTTDLEGTNSSNAPWVEHDYYYDDYGEFGLIGGYHNLKQEQVTASNAPTFARFWTYTPNDQTKGNFTYYTVDKVTHSETDDNNGRIWQCTNITYDEGAPSSPPTPAAGWPTTVTTYSNCANSATAITTYQGYDVYGNPVAKVDGVASANSSLYTSNGCTLNTAPAIFTSAWGKTRYTTCTVYDGYNAQPATVTNAFGQSSSITYDPTQGALPTSASDTNSQVTSTAYSYDSGGNSTVQVTLPLHSGSYTNQSSTKSGCTNTSTLPCYEIDEHSSLYPNAITRTFYDDQGRVVEKRATGATSSYDMITFTVYNDSLHSVFESVPFAVQSSLNNGGWVDPNGAVDYQGVAPGGTTTFYDALGRLTGTKDPSYGSPQEPGISCPGLQGTWTDCIFYGLGSANGDTATYFYAAVLDPNNHGQVSFSDALGRLLYTQTYSGTGLSSITANITSQKAIQYNALDEPTSVSVSDLAPQSGQTITSVTATSTYDDFGRVVTESDPDRGSHTYTYDGDGQILTDTSGTRTLGYNYDLLGRVGCVQDAAPTINATGTCTGGTHPIVQNTYDTTVLGTKGSTDFPVGELTQSVATTYFPDGTQATVTQQMQHDQRGRITNETLQLGLPSSWNVTSALPTYQIAMSYNDADQLTTTTTSTNPSGQGYTTTQVYDSATGMITGLSNNSSPTANLATLTYNARGLEDTLNFQTTSGSPLATEQFTYDANLRATSETASWQSGSGSSGTIFSQSRSYDPGGNVTSLSTTQGVVPGQPDSGGSETQNFCYDEQNRLLWAGNSGSQPGAGNGTCGSGTLTNSLSGASYTNTLVYTDLGQIWQGPLNGGSTQYQYLYCDSTHPHQLTGVYTAGTTCATKSDSNKVYTAAYDSWGNVISRFYSGTTATLSYDALDRFVEWNAGANNQEWNVYDSSGNRILSRITNGSGTKLAVYAFGLEEHSYSSSGVNQWNVYYYSLAGRLLGSLDGNGTTFYFTDGLGSVLASINAAPGGASIKGNQVFGPYGNARYYQGNINTSKGFTGQYNDGLTGLDYYNARYYDPTVGVFLAADTVVGNMQGVDPYTYVDENPETQNDPTGNCAWYDLGCLGQQAWQFTVKTASTVWNDGFVKPFQQTEQGLETAWNDGFVRPFTILVQQQQLIQKSLTSFFVKAAIVVGSAILAAILGSAARSKSSKGAVGKSGLNRTTAQNAQTIADAARRNWQDRTSSNDKKNYGGGYLKILGADGKVIYDDFSPPYISQTGNHVEQQVIAWATQQIRTIKGKITPGSSIDLIIFTRNPPCPGENGCAAALRNGTWAAELATAAGVPVRVQISTWYQPPKGPAGSVGPWS